jgi:hypothetical protein
VRIAAGDIVLLEGIQSLPEARARGKKLIVEIVGRLSKKEAQHLYRKSRIHKKIYNDGEDAVDDLFDYSEEDALSESEEDEVDIQANIKRGKVIRARKMVSTAEKSTGRGSGGMAGRGASGGRKDAAATVKEQMEAVAAAAGIRGVADEDDEEDLEAMMEGLGVAPKKAIATPKESVAAPTAVAKAPAGEEMWGEVEEKPFHLKSYENWEDGADDELDIDAI